MMQLEQERAELKRQFAEVAEKKRMQQAGGSTDTAQEEMLCQY